jgi:tetratricopeptide (TPR) repeat protein
VGAVQERPQPWPYPEQQHDEHALPFLDRVVFEKSIARARPVFVLQSVPAPDPVPVQLDLYGDVDERRSRATIEPGVVVVKIPKQEQKAWPQLKAVGSAADIKARREAALELKQARDAQALSDVKEKKRQDDDYVFHKQWDLEKDEKRTIERLAELHKREAEESLHAWSDAAEGRADTDTGKSSSTVSVDASKSVSTYFDKQLVEGDLNPFEARDGLVPLPGTYHKKTARTSAMEKSLVATPDSAFDIRAKEGDEADKKAVLEKEKEKEMEEARKAREDAAARERENDRKRAEAHRKEEQDRIMPLPMRERPQPPAGGGDEEAAEAAEAAVSAGPETKPPEEMPVWKEASSDSEDEEGKDGLEGGKAGGEGGTEVKPDVAKDEEKFLGRKKGASVNRWEAEKVAEQHRQVADAYFKVGLIAEAKKHELQAREAAPWLDMDVRHYDTPEEAAERKRREEEERAARPEPKADLPAPRTAGKVELNFTHHRRNLPARERIETDEEVAKREEEDYRQKKLENPDKARAPTHDQAMWLKLRGDHFYRTRDYRAAINAYTSCLELDARNPQALSNRAVCALRLRLWADAVADTTAAFDIFKRVRREGKDEEEWEQELGKRVRCLLRRGIAHTRLGMLEQAVADLDAAHKVLPDNDKIKDDLEELRTAISAHPYTKRKEEADKAFKQGDLEAALAAYDAALEADPVSVCLTRVCESGGSMRGMRMRFGAVLRVKGCVT